MTKREGGEGDKKIGDELPPSLLLVDVSFRCFCFFLSLLSLLSPLSPLYPLSPSSLLSFPP